jgi:hypothetical protein
MGLYFDKLNLSFDICDSIVLKSLILNFRLAHFNDYILILRPFSSKKMFLSGHFSCGFRF